jgi:REP element-mobilizing transposase RayT
MSHPLVIGYHLVWTAYGWWLPNDPRGSGSRTVRMGTLQELGEIHHGRKVVQPTGREIRTFYEHAEEVLKHPLLTFDEMERTIIGTALGESLECERYTCYACAVMPDHVHILIRKHRHTAEEMAENLMLATRAKLVGAGRREPTHPTWLTGPGWNVFLDHPDEVRRTIGYIERNPIKIGLPEHKWAFVQEYDNWATSCGPQPEFALRDTTAQTGTISVSVMPLAVSRSE